MLGTQKCGCHLHLDGSLDPCAYHGADACRDCGDLYPSDDLHDGLCIACIAGMGRVVCSDCGRLVPTDLAVETARVTSVTQGWKCVWCRDEDAVAARRIERTA